MSVATTTTTATTTTATTISSGCRHDRHHLGLVAPNLVSEIVVNGDYDDGGGDYRYHP
jgi:hypothetical protein